MTSDEAIRKLMAVMRTSEILRRLFGKHTEARILMFGEAWDLAGSTCSRLMSRVRVL